MAADKKSVVVYSEWIELFEALEDDEAGKLIKHFFKYVNNLNPEAPDRITELSFIPIKQCLKRDLKKYENYIDKQKANGLKGGRPKTQITQPFISKPKKADNVNVNVNVNDNVNDITQKSAYEFLKFKNLEEMQAFEMQNKKSFKNSNNFDAFIENFNNKVTLEGIPYEPQKLFARLRMLNANWDKRQKEEELETEAVLNCGNPNR